MPKPYPSENEEFPPCDICGKDPAECTCPICPKCHEQGNPGCYDPNGCGGLAKRNNRKTRQVDVIAYQDETIWRVALNLRGVVSAPYVLMPIDGQELGRYLQGGGRFVMLPSRARQVNRALQALVADDLLPEVGRQLENMSNLARYNQVMVDRDQPQANRAGQYLM